MDMNAVVETVFWCAGLTVLLWLVVPVLTFVGGLLYCVMGLFERQERSRTPARPPGG